MISEAILEIINDLSARVRNLEKQVEELKKELQDASNGALIHTYSPPIFGPLKRKPEGDEQ